MRLRGPEYEAMPEAGTVYSQRFRLLTATTPLAFHSLSAVLHMLVMYAVWLAIDSATRVLQLSSIER